MGLAERLGVFQRFHGVERFAGLGNGDHQLFGVGNHIAVAVFAGDFHIGGNFGDALEPVFAGEGGIIRGAAGKDFDAVDAGKHFTRGFAEIFRLKAAVEKHFGGVGDGAGLLVDFFLHKVAVGPELQRGER